MLKLTSMNRRAFLLTSAAAALAPAALSALNPADAKEAMFGNKVSAIRTATLSKKFFGRKQR